MSLAHTRLGHRYQRPGIELTQDLVEANLVKEIHELRNVAANLQRMLCEVCDIRNSDELCANNNFLLISTRCIIYYRQRHRYVICSKRKFNSKKISMWRRILWKLMRSNAWLCVKVWIIMHIRMLMFKPPLFYIHDFLLPCLEYDVMTCPSKFCATEVFKGYIIKLKVWQIK